MSGSDRNHSLVDAMESVIPLTEAHAQKPLRQSLTHHCMDDVDRTLDRTSSPGASLKMSNWVASAVAGTLDRQISDSSSKSANSVSWDSEEHSRGHPLRGLSVNFLSGQWIELMGANKDPELRVFEVEPLLRELSQGTCPRDGREGCAYVDAAPDPHAGRARHMLSYSWGYKLMDIASALTSYCMSTSQSPQEVRVWICCCCINQHRVKESVTKGDVVPFHRFREEFAQRVYNVDHILALMSPWYSPQYIERVWCIFEFYTANSLGKEVVVLMPPHEQDGWRTALASGGQQRVFKTLSNIRVQNAKASVMADRESILKLIDPDTSDHQTSRAVSALNSVVRAKLKEWFVETAAGYLESQIKERESHPTQVHNAIGRLLIQACSDYPRAQKILEAGLKQEEAPSVHRANALMLMGWVSRFQGRLAQAHHLCRQSKDMFQACGGTDTKQYATLLKNIGTTYMKGGHVDLAMQSYIESKAAFESADACESELYACLLKSIGAAHGMQNNRKEDQDQALHYYELSRCVYERLGVFSGPDYADLLTNLGAARGFLGDSEAEMKLYWDAMDAYELAGVTHGPFYAALLMNIGVAYGSRDKLEEELKYYLLAMTCLEKSGAAQGPNYAKLLMNMGSAYGLKADRSKQLKLFKEARNAYEAAGVARGPDYAMLLTNVAELHDLEGNTDAALKCFDEAVAAYKAANVDTGADYANLLRHMARTHQKRGDDSMAMQLFEQAKQIYEDAGMDGSPEHQYVKEALRCGAVPSRKPESTCPLKARGSSACALS